MSISTNVPVTITPEASARVDELGLRAELEQMLEHARQTVPDLTRIELTYLEPYDTGIDPGIGIEAYINRPFIPEDRISETFARWEIGIFPPEVLQYFTFLLRFETNHAG